MIKKTLCFSNPAYLSLRNDQLVIKLPEVEKTDNLTEDFKKAAEVTRPIEDIGVVVLRINSASVSFKMVLPCFSFPSMCAIVPAWRMQRFIANG